MGEKPDLLLFFFILLYQQDNNCEVSVQHCFV